MWQPWGQTWIGAIGGHVVPDDGRLLAEWLTNDIVYTAVTRNAMAVASLPWRLFRVRAPGSAQPAAPRRVRDSITAKAAASASVHAADELEELTSHPLLDLLAGPSAGSAWEKSNDPAPERLGGWSLWYMTGVMLDVFGACYWRIIPGRLGLPAEIRLLPTQMVQTLRDDHMRVRAYLYTPPMSEKHAVQIEIDASEVLSFRFPAVEDPWGGRQSPLRSAYGAATLAVKYNDFQNSLFENRARIDGTFIPKEVISPEEAERAEQIWNQKFARTGNGRVRVATQAGTFVPTSYAPQDLGELKISQDALKRVCDAFGLPEALLSKDATYANMQSSLHLHALQAVKPRVELIEAELNRRLVPIYGADLVLAADNPVPAEEAVNIQRAQIALTAGVITPNEARAALGFDRLESEGADQLPRQAAAAADAVTDAGVEAPVDFPSPAAEPGALVHPAPMAPEKASGADDWLLAVNDRVGAGRLERSVAVTMVARSLTITDEQARRLVGHPIRGRRDEAAEKGAPPFALAPAPPALMPGQAELTQQAADYLSAQSQTIAAWLAEMAQAPAQWSPPLPLSQMPEPAAAVAALRQHNWWGPFGTWLGHGSGFSPDDQAAAAAWMLGLFDEQRRAVANILREPERAAATSAAERVADALAVAPGAARDALVSAALASTRRAREAWSAVIVATTLRRLGAAITGMSREQVAAEARRIVDEVFADAPLRAREIAAEELFRADQMAARAAAEATPYVARVIWVTAGDEKVCPVCGALDGHGVEVNQPFDSAVGPLDAPPAHVACRCTLWFVTGAGRLLDVSQHGGQEGRPSSALVTGA